MIAWHLFVYIGQRMYVSVVEELVTYVTQMILYCLLNQKRKCSPK